MRLFAEGGFDATSVGEIESAAGLQPRRGALYKHFPSKEALLEAAVRTKLDDARRTALQVAELDLTSVVQAETGMLRPLVAGLGRWFLDEMDRLEDLTRIFEHDGRRLDHLVAEVRTEMVDLSYRTAATLISAVSPGIDDPDAVAVVILAPLVAIRRTEWTYGAPPLGIDDERLLLVWARHALAALDAP